MPQVTTTLSMNHISHLKEMAMKKQISVSGLIKSFIEKELNNVENKGREMDYIEHEEIIMRILKLTTETYAMTFDSSKTNNEFSNADDVINLIKKTTRKDIEEKYSIRK